MAQSQQPGGRSCPLRGHYALVGMYLMRAGVRTISGRTILVTENTNSELLGIDPEAVPWLTSRAVNSAIARAGIAVKAGMDASLNAVKFDEKLVKALKEDPRAAFRLTEDAIVHITGGETPANRSYAKLVIKALNDSYGSTAVETTAA